MARTAIGRRFFTVKVWSEWLPPVDGTRYVEYFLLLVAARSPAEAERVAWTEELQSYGLEISCHGTPTRTYGLGVEHVHDTCRDSLDDFDDDPLVFSQLFPIETQGIDFFDRSRLVRPERIAGEWEVDLDLPEYAPVETPIRRWFGVKLWRTWAGTDTRFLEEVVLVVRARSAEEAGKEGTRLAVAADTDVVSETGELLRVRTVNLDQVDDSSSRTLVTQMGSIVYDQTYDLDDQDIVGYFDPDNDLPSHEGALKFDRFESG